MENLEINKSAKELAEKAIKTDIEYINSVLNNLCLSEISRGYKIITIETGEALDMLRDKGFKVNKSPYSKGKHSYVVSWLSTEEEQA